MSTLIAHNFCGVLILQVTLLSRFVVADWGLGGSCQKYKQSRRKPAEVTSSNKYGLWPGLTSSSDLENGEVIFGFDEVIDLRMRCSFFVYHVHFWQTMEAIWRNQNPPDCSKAKYLILEGWMQGFGSEFHIYGVGLAAAVDSGRVLLQQGIHFLVCNWALSDWTLLTTIV